MAVDPLKVAVEVGDRVKSPPITFLKPADVLITDEVIDAPFHIVKGTLILKAIKLYAGEAIPSGSNGAVFTVKMWPVALPITVASVETSGGVSGPPTPTTGTILLPLVPDGSLLTISIEKAGDGIILPACWIYLEYTPVAPS